MSMDYGSKGCRCWLEDMTGVGSDVTGSTWLPNASCPYHGLLAPYRAPRADTGTYRVIRPPVLPELAEKDAEADIWGGVLSPVEEYDESPRSDITVSCGCGLAFTGPQAAGSAWILGHEHKIEEKETGVLAAVRRGIRILRAPFRC